jgi:four helix bundle protein
MHQFEKIKIWQKAMNIAIDVYKVTSELPSDEKFNLTHQIKKCAISIPSNIAEGSGRNSNNEFVHLLGIANGSTYELMTQLIISKRLELVEEKKVTPIINNLIEVCTMNFAL